MTATTESEFRAEIDALRAPHVRQLMEGVPVECTEGTWGHPEALRAGQCLPRMIAVCSHATNNPSRRATWPCLVIRALDVAEQAGPAPDEAERS